MSYDTIFKIKTEILSKGCSQKPAFNLIYRDIFKLVHKKV